MTRRPLPVVAGGHSGRFDRCRWACGDACAHVHGPGAGAGEPFASIAERGLTRRGFLLGGAAAGIVAVVGGPLALRAVRRDGGPPAGPPSPEDGSAAAPAEAGTEPSSTLGFTAIEPSTEDAVVVAEGYEVAVLLRWGDAVLEGYDDLDAAFEDATAAKQVGRFGYGNDFVAYLPAERGGDGADGGLLWVNHEFSVPHLMVPGYDPDEVDEDHVTMDMAAHGGTVVEVRRVDGGAGLEVVRDGARNRRITAATPMLLTGPAAGHPWLRTAADPEGREVLGTAMDCAGGVTPWGTVLIGEENTFQLFGRARLDEDDPRRDVHGRYGIALADDPGEEGPPSERRWERFARRFDVGREPNEPFRWGWVVEVDPYDPTSTPRKRTALGRFTHEGAETVVAPDGRVVVYMGDDQPFQHLYKFVCADPYRPDDPEAARDLLDRGTLYAARFDDDGTGRWLPLVAGEGALADVDGFATQGDVLIDARRAAAAVGATPMDRTEDVVPDPSTGAVYVACTKNPSREQVDAANPRARNRAGHVLELYDEPDPTGTRFRWSILLLCGDPDDPSTSFAGFPKDLVSPIATPDNLLLDGRGNLWIATDGAFDVLGAHDGLHAVPLHGPERGYVQQLLSVPAGAEATGPALTPDGRLLLLSVQHPGVGGTYEEPLSTFPDADGPPRPAVVVVRRRDGGLVGD